MFTATMATLTTTLAIYAAVYVLAKFAPINTETKR
jgi:hypothetical protein